MITYILATIGVLGISYLMGAFLGASEQKVYANRNTPSGALAYEAMVNGPVIESHNAPTVFSDSTSSLFECLFCAGENTYSWYGFGVLLICAIFGLHFYIG